MGLNIEDKSFHIILIAKNGIDHRRVLDKISTCASLGFRRFIIHVFTNVEKPLYLEGMRNIIFNNIAYTLILKHHKLAGENVKNLLKQLGNKPHKVIEKLE